MSHCVRLANLRDNVRSTMLDFLVKMLDLLKETVSGQPVNNRRQAESETFCSLWDWVQSMFTTSIYDCRQTSMLAYTCHNELLVYTTEYSYLLISAVELEAKNSIHATIGIARPSLLNHLTWPEYYDSVGKRLIEDATVLLSQCHNATTALTTQFENTTRELSNSSVVSLMARRDQFDAISKNVEVLIRRMRNCQGPVYVALSEEERTQIEVAVSNVHSGVTRWYRCRNGHQVRRFSFLIQS